MGSVATVDPFVVCECMCQESEICNWTLSLSLSAFYFFLINNAEHVLNHDQHYYNTSASLKLNTIEILVKIRTINVRESGHCI